jgi:hypothetical protein
MFSDSGFTRGAGVMTSVVFTLYMPSCGAPKVMPARLSPDLQIAELWQRPADLADRDLFYGPWGQALAPDPQAAYTFVQKKQRGTNPGMTVSDPLGREWHVKQPPHDDEGAEGPVEVVLSRVLSAIGYHQPPEYFLPSFTMVDSAGSHTEPGGRFRLHDKTLKDDGHWSWQQNPFVGTKPYQGLLVILMLFDSSDLKNDNNTLYALRTPDAGVERWYVVRDLGTALGETGRVAPKRSDPDLFERNLFMTRVKNGFVEFDYHGFHQELFRRRITPDDVVWACALLSGLTDLQWHDAFRAGGYQPPIADRFIHRIYERIEDGKRLAETAKIFSP